MKATRIILCFLLALGGTSVPLMAQSDSLGAVAKSSRVALLPFANYAEATDAMPQVMSLVRAELVRKHVPLMDPQVVADALRSHRVRNTNQLTIDQIQALTDDLAADYLLVGSLDRYVQSSTDAEVAVSAWLIYVPTVSMEWVGTATRHTMDGIHPLDLGRHRSVQDLSQYAVAELFQHFHYTRPLHRKQIESVSVGRGNQLHKQLCEKILVVPLANESGLYNAGGILYNHLMRALDDYGYVVVEPGRAREAMMEEGDMAPGKASANLLKICREELGVNLILTGTVSTFDCATEVNMAQVPSIAFEGRLIDTETGQVVWAKSIHGDGDDTKLVFGIGTTYSASSVAERVARRLVKSIPARRVRKA